MDDPGDKLSGQRYDPEDDAVVPFKQQMVRYDGPDSLKVTGKEGNAGTDIQPEDAGSAKVTEWDLTAIQAVLDAISVKLHTVADRFRLPDVLVGVTTSFTKSGANGSESMPVANVFGQITGAGSLQMSPTAQAQGSATIATDVVLDIRETWAENIPATVALFYIDDNASRAQVLAKATTILGATVADWPVFKPRYHNLKLISERVNVSVRAQTRVYGSFNGDGLQFGNGHEWGNGESYDLDVTQRTLRIGPVINAAITVASATDTKTATAVADASTPEWITTAFTEAAVSNSKSATATANGSVSPTSLSASTGLTGIPVTGLKVLSIQPGSSKYGRIQYRVVAIDFSIFA